MRINKDIKKYLTKKDIMEKKEKAKHQVRSDIEEQKVETEGEEPKAKAKERFKM